MTVPEVNPSLKRSILHFVDWLDRYGETSQDHQDFYASKLGRAAKNLYYRRPLLGKLAALPMVACEAFMPWTRKYYFPRNRLPISDAHYAMGFAALHEVTGDLRFLERSSHFLDILEKSRCPGYSRHGWGYPFDWQTRGGVLTSGTPLITTTPYCYEAFLDVYRITGDARLYDTMRSIADHCHLDYRDVEVGPDAATCTYTPSGGEKVVNASAYRAFTLFSAAKEFNDDKYLSAANKNLNFVLQCQLPDGSWPYAVDGERPFVDHFHTCFVMKALAKIEHITANPKCTDAIERGVKYYIENLFDDKGLPRPFARRPRLVVYKRELYDCAECINLGVLLRGRFKKLDDLVNGTVNEIINRWQLPDGHFHSRLLLIGWDDVPMHRWGHSEMFRSLCLRLKADQHANLIKN